MYLISCMMILCVVGCSKEKETASEVMEKVQQNYADAYGLEMKMDADYTISISGMELKMDLEMAMKQENMQDPDKLVMESELVMQMLGQRMSMKEWVKDGVAYMDDATTKTKQDLNTAELQEMSEKMGAMSQETLTGFAKDAKLEKTEDGYVISGSLADDKAFAQFMEDLGLGDSLGVEVSEMLSSLKVEAFDVSYMISKEYEIEKAHFDLKAGMTVEGQEMTLDLSMDMEMDAYNESKIKLPDFSAWDIKSVSCSFEGSGISELMVMNALDDQVEEIQSYMVIDYAAYGIESEEDKAVLIQNMQAMYQAYEGIECTVDDLGDEMGVAIYIDMKKASTSSLIELGLAGEGSIEGQTFSLAQSILGLQASGYECN